MRLEQCDVVVLGAGAAGLMCAIAAGRRGRRVLVLDHADEPGRKILISGGGRCNFTNMETTPARFFSANPHFCKSALARYTPRDFLDLVEKHGIPWHEKTLGQLFCDGSARAIVAMLMAECAAVGVVPRLGCRIAAVTRPARFRVATDTGEIEAESVVLATGGLSIPKLGATGLAHDIASRFGLRLTAIRPGLVPLVFAPDEIEKTRPLAGVSLPVVARCGAAAFREALLFTHRGISGPAILQISSAWHENLPIDLDLLPDQDATFLPTRKRARPGIAIRTALAELMPARMVDAVLPPDVPARRIGDVADRALTALGAALKSWRIVPSGSEGYAKAEVTLGGVDTADLSSRTMEARGVKNLFVIGEAVDVTGWLGGYNFQWAWASGWSAGNAA